MMDIEKVPEKTYRLLFRIGVAMKALFSLSEIAAGLIFSFFSYDSMYKVVFWLFGGELSENPKDFIWEYVFRSFKDFSATPQSVWAFIFLSHGIVKIFLATGLWRNKLWAYPASAAVFILFIAYQLYQLLYAPSTFLWLLTIFDAVLIFLILHEYHYKKKHLHTQSA